MLKESALEVYAKISERNETVSVDSIPHSNNFIREMESQFGIDSAEVRRMINILKESHYILSFEIVKEDKKNDVKRVEGYVNTLLPNLRALKNLFQRVLMDEYEKQFHNRLMVHQIVKEIYSRGASFVNSPLGQIANKAIMLEEFENLIEKEFQEFTDSWKEAKLNELVGAMEASEKAEARHHDSQPGGTEQKVYFPDATGVKRAVDSPEYREISGSGGHKSLKKMINIYGVEFFFRVHLRNYNFKTIIQALENKEIDRRADIRLLKDMLNKVKMNMDTDTRLYNHSEDIHQLERLILRSG
jgi:hypothetical protein